MIEIKNKIFTGVGARETPNGILRMMKLVSALLYKKGFTLRSGHSTGPDIRFEEPYFSADENMKEIYLPWKGFNGSNSKLYKIEKWAYDSVDELHPAPHLVTEPAKKLLARNYHQLLGYDETKSDFMICWTKNGDDVGGTGQTIRVARRYGIPIFNLAIEKDKEKLSKFLETLK